MVRIEMGEPALAQAVLSVQKPRYIDKAPRARLKAIDAYDIGAVVILTAHNAMSNLKCQLPIG